MHRVLCVALSLTLLPGCSGFFRDRTLEYTKAEPGPALVIPEGVDARPLRPLYPIPETTPSTTKIELDKASVPFPPAMKPVVVEQQMDLPDTPGRLVVKLGTDGNGIPELRVVGPRERVWDELLRALNSSNVSIKDRNQSLGLVDVVIAEQNFQVRMVRATEAFMITLQRNEDTLAPVNVSRTLLTTLQARWP
jgi:uncharacterized lipoprotein